MIDAPCGVCCLSFSLAAAARFCRLVAKLLDVRANERRYHCRGCRLLAVDAAMDRDSIAKIAKKDVEGAEVECVWRSVLWVGAVIYGACSSVCHN